MKSKQTPSTDSSNNLRIAVIADPHYSPQGNIPHAARRGDIADVLLLRAVHRLNRLLRPDLVVVAGDIVDDGDASEAPDAMTVLKNRLDLLNAPYMVLPGNHDGASGYFNEIFGPPPRWWDVKNCRFVPFIDPEEPGFNARRSEENFECMTQARQGFNGPLVALHHVPVFPEGRTESPYNYTNVETVIDTMRNNGYCMAVSGHYHKGFHVAEDDLHFVCAPATCVSPFPVTVVDLDASGADARKADKEPPCPDAQVSHHDLRLPDSPGLVDSHVHTQFAYCAEDVNVTRARSLAETFGLQGVGFSEHSDQLYFSRDKFHEAPAWNEAWMTYASSRDRRIDSYLSTLRETAPPESIGLEVESTHEGDQILTSADAKRANYLIGGIHSLPSSSTDSPSPEILGDEFLATAEHLAASGIDVLAHPFRIFYRNKLSPPSRLFDPLVRILRENGVAAEVNFHTNEPPEEFFRLCLDAGVKLTFGSDAHNLYEIGDFALHLDFLRRCGFDGDPSDVLIDPRR